MSGSFRTPRSPNIIWPSSSNIIHYGRQWPEMLMCPKVSNIYIIIVFCPKTGPSLKAEKPRLQFCRRQVFHRKLRNQGCSFTKDWIGAVASRCFPHPTLSLASEQTLKNLKDPRGTNEECIRRVYLANWALRTSPKFTTGIKYQFLQGFRQDQRSGNHNHPSPPKFTYDLINDCTTVIQVWNFREL